MSLAELLYGVIYFLGFYEKKFFWWILPLATKRSELLENQPRMKDGYKGTILLDKEGMEGCLNSVG